jgi:hypothetical protein
MRKSTSSSLSRRARVGIATGAAAVLVVAAAAPAMAAAALLTLSSATGPSGGLNTLTGTAPTAIFGATVTPAAEFQYVGTGTGATCSAVYLAPAAVAVTAASPPVQTAGVLVVAAASVKKLSTTKISVTVPSTVALGTNGGFTQASAKYNLCIYSGTTTGVSGSPLIANAPYTIAAKAGLTSVSPATGPALGNTQITVVGTNFPATGMTATIGGSPLTGITVASNGLSFSAITPAHASSGPLTLSVTTSGGVTSKLAAFAYTNGIVITPNTAPNTSMGADVDVSGVGFSALDFSTSSGASPDDTKSHVYLVRGTYDPTDNSGAKTLGETAECNNVLLVSDTEVICTLMLTRSLNAAGAIPVATTRTSGGDLNSTAASATVTSATANFTAADIGLTLSSPSNTVIPASTTILSINSPTSAVLSAPANTTATTTVATIGGPRTVATGATTSGSNALVGTAFSTADVGRQVTGTGIPIGTTITAVASATAATMSANATATGTSLSITIVNTIPVPIDTYTLTVVSNGGVDVQSGGANEDTAYVQSIVSSQATFTVSDY